MKTRQASKRRFKRFLADALPLASACGITGLVGVYKRLPASRGCSLPNQKTQSEVPPWQKA